MGRQWLERVWRRLHAGRWLPAIQRCLLAHVRAHHSTAEHEPERPACVFHSRCASFTPAPRRRRGKGTVFAYGQTGSGKTHSMAPLPLRAAEDILAVLALGQPEFAGMSLYVR